MELEAKERCRHLPPCGCSVETEIRPWAASESADAFFMADGMDRVDELTGLRSCRKLRSAATPLIRSDSDAIRSSSFSPVLLHFGPWPVSCGTKRLEDTSGCVSEALNAASEQEARRLPPVTEVSPARILSRLEEQIARVNALSWSRLNPDTTTLRLHSHTNQIPCESGD